MVRNATTAVVALLCSVAIGCTAEGPRAEGSLPAEEGTVVSEAYAEDTAALSYPQIAHVAVTANTIDIELGRLASSRAGQSEVRDFAHTMITDHTAVNEQASALAARLGVTPEPNAISTSLLDDAAAARAELERLNDDEFDRAYMAREVAFHETVLDALDSMLIPDASNTELRALLEQVRPAIAAHLDHARSIDSSLRDER